MSVVRVAMAFPGSVHEAERCWFDTSRWSSWVDGLAEVVSVEGGWPRAGVVSWRSHPAGRGRVVERVVSYEALSGQTVEVEDDSLRGLQTVAFAPADGTVEVAFSLDYKLRKRSLLTPLVDVLFIRRALTNSLRSTLTRFGVELATRVQV
jgi:hypothetical protein